MARAARGGQQEMIELQDLAPARGGRLERANALRIAPGRMPELLGRVRQARAVPGQDQGQGQGQGHAFRPRARGHHAWCDLCGDFIWGVRSRSLQCGREYLAGPGRAGGAASFPPEPRSDALRCPRGRHLLQAAAGPRVPLPREGSGGGGGTTPGTARLHGLVPAGWGLDTPEPVARASHSSFPLALCPAPAGLAHK